jgi:hypothetical protein
MDGKPDVANEIPRGVVCYHYHELPALLSRPRRGVDVQGPASPAVETYGLGGTSGC